jgi:hypothetical protein
MAFLTSRTLATGITLSDLFHIVKPYDSTQNPSGSSYKATVQQLFDSLSGYCISDFYVSNIHSCSPLNINPLDEGNVYFGSTSGVTVDVINKRIGINTDTPNYLIDFFNNSLDTRIFFIESSNVRVFRASGATNNLTLMGINSLDGLGNPSAIDIGIRGSSDPTWDGYGKNNDSFIYSSNFSNGLNIISSQGVGTEDYIRFFAGQDADGTIPDLYIQGTGTTRGYVGVGTETPLAKLHVDGDSIINNGLTADTLNISSTPNTDTQIGTEYLTRDSITGEVKIKQIAGPTVYGLFAQTGNSTTVSGTTSELSIIGSGIGSLSVPANGFSVGDSFSVRISGDIGANNGTNLTLRVKSGSVVFGQVGPISMPNVTSSHFSFEITFTIRALGTAGNAKIISSGYFTFTQNVGGSFEGGNFSTLNNTTFNTTVPNTLNITAQFNSTNSANFIFTELLVLNKIF